MRHLFHLLVAAGATAAVLHSVAPTSLRLPAPGRVVAVGDIHGDATAFLRTLKTAGLIDAEATIHDASWTGGNATLVQCGDILDRGAEEAECWALLHRLKAQAPQTDGRVVALLGNHEVMNVIGVAGQFVHPVGRTSFGPDRKAAFAAGGPLALELADLCCYVAVIIGSSCFVHANLPADATDDSLNALNTQTREWLLGERALEDLPKNFVNGRRGPQLTASPIWGRGLGAERPATLHCDAIRRTLRRLGVSRVVVGHTPQRSGINAACDGLVWRCDTGMSQFVCSGACEALEIDDRDDGLSAVRVLREGGKVEDMHYWAADGCDVDGMTATADAWYDIYGMQ